MGVLASGAVDAADLAPWSAHAEPVGRLAGGTRNEVWEVRLGGGVRAVARRSSRPPHALDWELDLLDDLERHGFVVPVAVRTLDGRRRVEDLVVCRWLDGEEPASAADWAAVAAELRRLHASTVGRPQRPGFASTTDLLAAERGGDADLAALPAGVVAEFRHAWAGLAGGPVAVVHGDPGPTNLRLRDGRVGILDWDESRVDATELDLADLPYSPLAPERLAPARAAADAWEAAISWWRQPSYARERLARLRARGPVGGE